MIPADHKWFARIVVRGDRRNALVEIDPQYPTLDEARASAPHREGRSKLEGEVMTDERTRRSDEPGPNPGRP